MKRVLILFGVVLSLCVIVSVNLNAQTYRYDATEMDNTIKFNVVKFRGEFCLMNLPSSNGTGSFYRWFSERPGLVTDKMWHTEGGDADKGFFTFHLIDEYGFFCDFLHQYDVFRLPPYSQEKSRTSYDSLKKDGEYYVLDLREFKGYVPLYLPYSKEHNRNVWQKGDVVFEWYGDRTASSTASSEEVITFRTPLDVFNFLQSRVFKSSDGITLDIRPDGVKANGRAITGAVQVTYIQRQQAIMKATSPLTGHTYTFIAYADRNCIVCDDDHTMYFGKK